MSDKVENLLFNLTAKADTAGVEKLRDSVGKADKAAHDATARQAKDQESLGAAYARLVQVRKAGTEAAIAEAKRRGQALAGEVRSIESLEAEIKTLEAAYKQAGTAQQRALAGGALRAAKAELSAVTGQTQALGKESASTSVAFGNITSAAILGALKAAKDTIVGLVQGVVELGVETGKSAKDQDNLQRLFGVTDTQAGALIYTLGGAGDAFDALGQLNANLQDAAKNGGESAERFKALGIAFDDGAGKARNVGDVLADIQAKAKQGFSKPELALLGQILGDDTAKKLLPTLENLDAVGQKALEAGAVLTGEAKQAALEFNAKVRDLDVQLLGLKTTVGAELIPVLQQVVPEVSKILRELLAIVKSNPELFESLAKVTGLIARTATPALSAFLKFVEANVVGLQSLAKFAASAFAFLTGDTKGAVTIFAEAARESDKATKKFAELIPALATIRKAFAEIGTGFQEAAKGNFGQAAQSFLDAKNTFGQAAGEIKTAVGNLVGGITGTGLAANAVGAAVKAVSPELKKLQTDYATLSKAQVDYSAQTQAALSALSTFNEKLVSGGKKAAVDSAREIYDVTKTRTDQEIKLAETAYQAKLRLIEQEAKDSKTRDAEITKARAEFDAAQTSATERRTKAQAALESELAREQEANLARRREQLAEADAEAKAFQESESDRLRQFAADQRLDFERARAMGADEVALTQIKIEQEQAYLAVQIESLQAVLAEKQAVFALDETNLQLKHEIAGIETQITELLAQQANVAATAGDRVREALERVKGAAGDAADSVGKVGDSLGKIGEVARQTQTAVGMAFDPKSAESLNAAILQVRQNIQALTALGFYGLAGTYQQQLQELFKLQDDLGREAAEAERERRRQLADDLSGIADEQADREADAAQSLADKIRDIGKREKEENENLQKEKADLAKETADKIADIEKQRADLQEQFRQEDLQRTIDAENAKAEAVKDARKRSEDDQADFERDAIRKRSDFRKELADIDAALAAEKDPAKRADLLKQKEGVQADQKALEEKGVAEKERQADIEKALASGKSKEEIDALVEAANEKFRLRTQEIDDLLEARKNGDAKEIAELEAFYAEQRKRAADRLQQSLKEIADRQTAEETARQKDRADRLGDFDQQIKDVKDAEAEKLTELQNAHAERMAELKRERQETRAEYQEQLTEILNDTKQKVADLKIEWSDYVNFVKGQLGQISPGGPGKTGSTTGAGAGGGGGTGGGTRQGGGSPGGPGSGGSGGTGGGGSGSGQRRGTPPPPPPPPKPPPPPSKPTPPSPTGGSKDEGDVFGQLGLAYGLGSGLGHDLDLNKADKEAAKKFADLYKLAGAGLANGQPIREQYERLREIAKQVKTAALSNRMFTLIAALLDVASRTKGSGYTNQGTGFGFEEGPSDTPSGGQQIVQDHAPPDKFGEPPPGPGGLKATGETITTTKPGGGTTPGTGAKPPATKTFDAAKDSQSIPTVGQLLLQRVQAGPFKGGITAGQAKQEWDAAVAQNPALAPYTKAFYARLEQQSQGGKETKASTGGGPSDIEVEEKAARERAEKDGKGGTGGDSSQLASELRNTLGAKPTDLKLDANGVPKSIDKIRQEQALFAQNSPELYKGTPGPSSAVASPQQPKGGVAVNAPVTVNGLTDPREIADEAAEQIFKSLSNSGVFSGNK